MAPEAAGRMKDIEFQEADLDCPRCKKTMKKLKKNNVIIDVCAHCNGMWLDDGEIEKLIEMGKHGKK